MTLLLESALRSLLLGLLVWALLKLVRMRDTGTETIIWTFVLMVALAMPLLSHYLPQLLVTLPHLTHPAAGVPGAADQQVSDAAPTAPALLWLARHGQLLLSCLYLLGALLCLARLIMGLVLTRRLYRRAVPVQADWVRGRRIRTSAALKGPASLAHTILLPGDFTTWSATKREAVLAHETAHIARGDFFVQLAASVHCALFWFSPFAWWLQSKLAEIAESASDEAAVQRLSDPLMYAEILVDVARRAQTAPLIIAMAKGPLIQQRIERILCATTNRNLSAPVRALVVVALTAVALTVASARAAVGQDTAGAPSVQPAQVTVRGIPATTAAVSKAAAARRRAHISHAIAPSAKAAAPVAKPEEVSYNPRALLEPVYVATRAYVPASTIVHDGRTFYIRSSERPVADRPLTDAK
jgi:beta-lactamase regulating signal transducer with metallopeptidase domain